MRLSPFFAAIALALSSCGAPVGDGAIAESAKIGDWRQPAIAKAQEKVRQVVSDPNAQFMAVHTAGNSTYGQVCGFVTAKFGVDGQTHTERFIDYIDGAGTRVEGNLLDPHMTQAFFDGTWRDDCIKEGYSG